MAKGKPVDRFVIFKYPYQYKAINTYYDWDGNVTTDRDKVAQFDTHEEAKDFANRKDIELLEGGPYIALETFYDQT